MLAYVPEICTPQRTLHLADKDDMELCMEYNKDLDRLKEILQPSHTAEEEERERYVCI